MERLMTNKKELENKGVYFYDYAYASYYIDNPGR